jgi:hypothetical protein
MVLRPEEEFVKDSLVKYFGGPDKAKAWEGENPPDIYVEIEGECIAVEITTLSPVSFDADGTVQNRATTECSIFDLCNELDSELRDGIPSEISIWLNLYVPVKNVRRFKKELCDYLVSFIAERPNVGNSRETNIANEKVEIFVGSGREPPRKKIVGIIWNKNSNPYLLNIHLNAEVILVGRIIDKQKKCAKVKGPIWLALYNDYWLADNRNYVQAINNIGIEHRFGRIFVIQKTSQVHQIYPKTA